MEVHPHAHTERKKWYHYFWEFFMLFLAVSLGFLVENQREHFVEHQRAKVFAANLYEELNKDTASLNYLVRRHEAISGQLDTLCLLLRNKDQQHITNGMLYYYGSSVTFVSYFSSNNTTVEQLKSSGNLRIMGNELAYKISEYDKLIRELEKEYGLSKSEFAKIEDIHFRVMDMYILETIFPDNKHRPKDSVFLLTDLPVKKDPELIKEYTGWLKFEADIYRYQVTRYLSPLKKAATELLDLLKKKYHLQ